MKTFSLSLLLLVFACPAFAADAAPREQICLNGVWKFTPGSVDQNALDPNSPTYDIPVPAFWDKMAEFGLPQTWPVELTRGWYRRSFDVNPAWEGKKILLRFEGVRYVSQVFVNGKMVGGSVDGFIPFELDVTKVVHFDKPNDLLVKVSNWRGLLHPSKKDIEMPFQVDVRDVNAFLAPAGIPPRAGNQAGIWQDVWLLARPVNQIERVKIDTSLTNHTLTVNAWTQGPQVSEMKLRHDVLEADKTVLTAEAIVDLSGQADTKSDWANPTLWWPYAPHLYTLRTQLLDKDNNVVDEITTPFGFREIAIQGENLFLNGQRLNLLSDSYVHLMDPAGMAAFRKEYTKAFFEQLKRCNINAVRLHCNPSPASTLEAADEVGMLILAESATYGSEAHFRSQSKVFQKNDLQHIERWMQRDWNHPSIIAWSLSNEFSPPAQHLKDMYELAKSLDSTRIVYHEAIFGPYSDVWSGHYTWDWSRTCQLPNTAYWYNDPAWVKRTLGISRQELNKPLFISEFYNVDTTAKSPATTVLLGPRDKDTSLEEKRNLHFYALRYVAEGGRYAGLADIGPFCLLAHFWSFCATGVVMDWPAGDGSGVRPTHLGALMVNPGWAPAAAFAWSGRHEDVKFAFNPMYAFSREYSHTFWSGETVKRTLVCFNDELRPLPKKLRWQVKFGDTVVAEGQRDIATKIGYYDEFPIEFTVPTVETRTDGTLELAVDVDGNETFHNSLPLTVFPKILTPIAGNADAKIGFFRLSADQHKTLQGLNIEGTDITSSADLSGVKVILLGTEGDVTATDRTFYEALAKFVEAGGCVIAFEQTNSWWMPGNLPIAEDSWSTIGFKNMEHPVVAGLTDGDLRFWGADNTISRGNYLLKELPSERINALVVEGSAMGLAYTSLLEYRYGKGSYLLCQMPVLSKGATEASAGVLLRNLVSYAKGYTCNTPAPAEAFTYRKFWRHDITLTDAQPAVAPNRYYFDGVSQTYGSDTPVMSWMPNNGFGEWIIKDLPKGLSDVSIRIRVRSGGTPHKYTLTINGKVIPLPAEYQHVQETFDSAQGWKICVGDLSTPQPIKLRNGDKLRITSHQDWSAIVQIQLTGVIDE